jgi:hypothetical protein
MPWPPGLHSARGSIFVTVTSEPGGKSNQRSGLTPALFRRYFRRIPTSPAAVPENVISTPLRWSQAADGTSGGESGAGMMCPAVRQLRVSRGMQRYIMQAMSRRFARRPGSSGAVSEMGPGWPEVQGVGPFTRYPGLKILVAAGSRTLPGEVLDDIVTGPFCGKQSALRCRVFGTALLSGLLNEEGKGRESREGKVQLKPGWKTPSQVLQRSSCQLDH